MFRSSTDITSEDEFKKLMKIEHTYPNPTDKDFQNKIYIKREFYYHKIPERSKLKDYKDIKKYRDDVCNPFKFEPLPHQSFLSNFINPNTPYKGLLIFHGTGTGKCHRGDQLLYINSNIDTFENIWKKYNNYIFKKVKIEGD
uniref:DEAD/SNF2-like helicase n=1 Tax=Mimivirus LCMiAC01 TaxID=2506608 RepID=A0A481Z013_9VIRU|nr:MAG: DEAD/SNF2-like helicase [Mimivirus LCMiAC01]